MAKVAFNKLNKVKSIPDIVYEWEGNDFIIKQYLPLEKKLDIIETVISLSGNGEEGFFNIIKLQTFYTIEMLKNYTNISFTEKQEEDPAKLYDGILLNHIWENLGEQIPERERVYIWDNILELAHRVTEYNNSVLGVLKNVSQNKEALDFNLTNLIQDISNPEKLETVRQLFDVTGLTS